MMHIQAVQYITCDQNWVIIAGFIPERTNKVCRAVRKEVILAGDGVGSLSEKRDCSGVVDEPRARAKLWRRDAKPLFDCNTEGGVGDGGRLVGEGDGGKLLAVVAEGGLFLLPKDLNKDHSDSN
jgi:hypothetical protein